MCSTQVTAPEPGLPRADGSVWEDGPVWEDEELWGEDDQAGAPVQLADAGDQEAQRSPWQRMVRVFPFDPVPVHAPEVSDEELMRVLRDGEAMVSQIAARQAQALVELRKRRLLAQAAAHPHPGGTCTGACCDEDGWVATEVAVELGLSDRQVGTRIDASLRLARHPSVAALMASGQVQSWTATKLLEHLDILSAYVTDDRLAQVEQATVAWLLAAPRTVGRLNARMRRIIVAAKAAVRDDEPGADVPEPGHADRRLTVTPASAPGLAELVALLPEADALAIRATLHALGHDPADEHDERSADQRRADLLVTMVTGAPALHGRPDDSRCALHDPIDLQVRLDVLVPADSLTGGPQPAHVPGFGPVPAAGARQVASTTSSGACAARPLVYDPATGQLLGFGPTGVPMIWLDGLPSGRGYQHPALLESAVALRDGTCRAPGCLRPAARCDCDHVVPYPAGPTSLANSCSLCRRHHRLKTHAPGWAMTMGEDGQVTWTTPTGRQVTTDPYDYRPPAHDLPPAHDPPPF